MFIWFVSVCGSFSILCFGGLVFIIYLCVMRVLRLRSVSVMCV